MKIFLVWMYNFNMIEHHLFGKWTSWNPRWTDYKVNLEKQRKQKREGELDTKTLK